MKQIIMIADDLTGACDSGVQLARAGLRAAVCFNEEKAIEMQTDVLIFDSDSRALPPEKAYKAVEKITCHLNGDKTSLIYKKIDSTLRGNIGQEIDAVMDALSLDIAVVAPAFPSLKRTTKKGVQYVENIPVDQTELAKDVKTPVQEANIVRMLSTQSKREAGLLPEEILQKGHSDFKKHVDNLFRDGVKLFVMDAETETHLEEIAYHFKKLPYSILWTGSAGLAEKLPVSQKEAPITTHQWMKRRDGLPVFTVAGSRSQVTKKQVISLQSHTGAEIVELKPDNIVSAGDKAAEINRCHTCIRTYFESGKDVILKPAQDNSIKDAALPYLIAEVLGAVVAGVLPDYEINGMIVAGGDTAKAISKELGVDAIELIDEIEPGLPLSRMIGGPKLPLITKAGAFGHEKSLVTAYRQLKGGIT
ncbi:four-carbon acid sugar kinase family protein [Bacillus piscicola]|uniref:four-carbon acid sugar kinase family protein n=1 Tax=Bacillus piscicola TaxID=1632684 RepID=UPI001F09D8E4|nr:four-carbon acid sugar kinase family protein [Bacillus piscicola]